MPCEHAKIPRIFAVPSAVLANETSSERKRSAAEYAGVPNCACSDQAGNYDDKTRTEDGDADLHRPVGAEDFVFA